MTRSLSRRARKAPVLLLAAALLLPAAACKTPEQRMIGLVENWRSQGKYDAALDYLEKYLGKYSTSLAGWRYRVLLRLDQEKRPAAAQEYKDLTAALGKHEATVLREVVLGAGGRWLVSDYRTLARCASEELAGVDFFADVLEPKHLGEGSMTKVAVRPDEIAAVVDALPGQLPPDRTWALIEKHTKNPSADLRARLVSAAGRHIARADFGEAGLKDAMAIVREAAGATEEPIREAALLAATRLADGPGKADFLAGMIESFGGAGDTARAATLMLSGPSRDGLAGWSKENLTPWAETGEGLARVLAVGALARTEPSRARLRFLGKAADGGAAEKLGTAATRGFLDDKVAKWAGPKATWAALDVEDRRAWAPVFVRGRGRDRGDWVMAILSDTDALVGQAAAEALAVPGAGADPVVDAAIEQAMQGDDAVTLAAATKAAVVRGACGLGLAVAGAFAKGDDRVMTETLQAVVATGDPMWIDLVDLGLKAEVPTVRELAVDAAAATCSPDQKERMEALLTDEDPHVAVRAAAALYLLVGSEATTSS